MFRQVSRLSLLLLPALSCAATGAADAARGLRDVELDPAACYRVHDLKIDKDDIHLYFTDGYLIFGKPVNGVRTAAVFTNEVEAGDAELLLLPPDRSERRSLADYTSSPNLDEHLNAAVLLFADGTAEDLLAQIRANEFDRPSPEAGAIMAGEWKPVVRNLSASFESRLLLDLLAERPTKQGCFVAAIQGKRLGSFDVIYEPRSAEQITVGQIASRNNLTFFDVWTSFAGAPYRKGAQKLSSPEISLQDYRIDATLEPSLLLRVTTKVKVTLKETSERVLPFEITGRMQVSSATVDGRPADVLQPESLRSNLVRNDGNNLFLVVAPQPLEAGRAYELEFHHEGSVVLDTGNRIYYVGPRSTWYPNSGLQFARYDLTFRYPKDLDLVTAGDIVSDHTEGEWRTTRRVSEARMRFAGFNLGVYDRTTVAKGGYTVEVCANRAIESALRPNAPAPKTPNPPARLEELAAEVASALEFMAAQFGPPPLKTLEVSPIPGTFGQGFPGLLYLSTMTYLRREDEAMASLHPRLQSFFIDLLQAHETAHQWWGNVVATASYHDEWLMEALANYSALMYLEKRNGRPVLDAALDTYRAQLLAKNAGGRTAESAGPIVLGGRLSNSISPSAWTTITYGKGAWILHMLRARMGDERFLAMLGELRRRYEWKTISTDEFRRLAVEFLPPQSPDPKLETFFDQWVYGTGVPALKLSYATQGRAPTIKLTGTVSQTDVDSDFIAEVPVQIECAGSRQVKWLRTTGGAAQFTVVLPQIPARVSLDTSNILAVAR